MVTQPSLKIETIGDLEGQHTLTASCDACQRYTNLDIPALVARYGAHLPIAKLKARLRCDQCGRPGNVTIGTPWV